MGLIRCRKQHTTTDSGGHGRKLRGVKPVRHCIDKGRIAEYQVILGPVELIENKSA